jgi:predicted NBD/HSP70 family sugar kinase
MIAVFDIGATHTRFALASNGELGEVVHMETDPSARGFGKFLGSLEAFIGTNKVQKIVGGMPGGLEGDDGVLSLDTNLPAWVGMPVKSRMRKLFDCPIIVANDVVMGGLGESHFGAGTKNGVMAYFTISTGVNGVRIVNGRPDSTIARYEIGYQVIATEDGEPISLESRVGGRALEERTGHRPQQMRDPKIWNQVDRDLAIGLYNTLLHWTPDLVVVGGMMTRDINLVHVRDELEKLPRALLRIPALSYAKLGDTAGLYGAIALTD